MLGGERRLPDQLISDRLEPEHPSIGEHVLQLSCAMQKAHGQLRSQQGQVRTEVDDKGWLRSKGTHTNKSSKFLKKLVGSLIYCMSMPTTPTW